MKIKITLISLTTLLAIVVYYKEIINEAIDSAIFYSECENTLTYKITRIDEKFNLSFEDIIEQTNQAAHIWNAVSPNTLFAYDPNGEINIELIYDERQDTLTDINTLDSKIKTTEPQIQDVIKDYNNRFKELETEIDELNKTINYWNNNGGAPEDEYEKIIETQNILSKKADKLNEEANEVNKKALNFNEEVEKLDNTILSFNQIINMKPEGGLYKPAENKIEIYIYGSSQEYVHLAAHELGHALLVEHTNNPDAIMNPNTSDKIALTNDDLILLRDQCRIKNRLQEIRDLLTQIN